MLAIASNLTRSAGGSLQTRGQTSWAVRVEFTWLMVAHTVPEGERLVGPSRRRGAPHRPARIRGADHGTRVMGPAPRAGCASGQDSTKIPPAWLPHALRSPSTKPLSLWALWLPGPPRTGRSKAVEPTACRDGFECI